MCPARPGLPRRCGGTRSSLAGAARFGVAAFLILVHFSYPMIVQTFADLIPCQTFAAGPRSTPRPPHPPPFPRLWFSISTQRLCLGILGIVGVGTIGIGYFGYLRHSM